MESCLRLPSSLLLPPTATADLLLGLFGKQLEKQVPCRKVSPPPYLTHPVGTDLEQQLQKLRLNIQFQGIDAMQVLKGVPSAFLEVIFTTQCRHALAKSMCLITDYDEWLSLFFLSLIYLGSERDSDLQLVVLCVPTPPFTSTPHTEVSFFFPLVLNLTVENEHVGIHVKFNVWFEFQSLLDLGLGKFMSA